MHINRETGEIVEGDDIASAENHAEPRETLSQRATAGVKAPGYWDKRQGVMATSDDRRFNNALFRAQSEIEALIDADAHNPFHKSRYTTLGMLLSVVRPVLKKHQLIIKQGAGKVFAHKGDKGIIYFLPVFMEIVHAPSCERERQMVEIPLTKIDPQAIGVAITYGRRYLVQSYFGIASMDDDAASAVQKRLDKDDANDAVSGIIEKIKECASVAELEKWAKANKDGLNALSDEHVAKLRTAYEERKRELQDTQAPKKEKP
jgi:hypothetical protein